MAAISEAVLQRWFTPEFAAAEPATVARMKAMLERVPVEGYGGGCAAVRDLDQREALARIAAPTLVVVGTPRCRHTARGRPLHRVAHRRRTLVELPAAHLSNIEQPAAFTAALVDFLA